MEYTPYIYRVLNICEVRYITELSCRNCKYYKTNECRNLISVMQEHAEQENRIREAYKKGVTHAVKPV